MRRPRFLVGLLVAALGAIWALQGAGLLDGGIITWKPASIAVGLVTAGLGIGLMVWGLRPYRA